MNSFKRGFLAARKIDEANMALLLAQHIATTQILLAKICLK
jgi:hypothetical protein